MYVCKFACVRRDAHALLCRDTHKQRARLTARAGAVAFVLDLMTSECLMVLEVLLESLSSQNNGDPTLGQPRIKCVNGDSPRRVPNDVLCARRELRSRRASRGRERKSSCATAWRAFGLCLRARAAKAQQPASAKGGEKQSARVYNCGGTQGGRRRHAEKRDRAHATRETEAKESAARTQLLHEANRLDVRYAVRARAFDCSQTHVCITLLVTLSCVCSLSFVLFVFRFLFAARFFLVFCVACVRSRAAV